MAVRLNAGYNSPEIAAVAQNIAQMFGPPSGSELAAYSTARKNNQQSNIVAQLSGNPDYQGFDHQAILADLYDPTQSFQRVEMDDATTRRGQDVNAQTAITTNANTNRTGLISDMFGPLNEGQVRPALPAGIADMYGLPELPQAAGMPKPLSQDQVLGGQTQRLIDQGQINDQMLISTVMGDVPVENIVGPNGPVIQYRDQAVGSEPYFNPGAEAKPTNGVAVLRDGSKVPAVQDTSTGKWRHAQTGVELPADIQIFATPQAQGTAAEIGMVSKPTDSQIEQQLIDIAVAKQTAGALRTLIADSPSSQGIVGALRGTAQNVIQTGGELGTFFGGGVAEAMADIENGLADASLAGAFDGNIPAIDMLSNLLAFQYAKTTTGERLSNEMLNASRRALGLDGLDANQANSLARLDRAIQQIEAQEAILTKAREGGVGALAEPSTQPTAASAAAAEVWDFDESGNLVRMQ